jgi:hypothetical protein
MMDRTMKVKSNVQYWLTLILTIATVCIVVKRLLVLPYLTTVAVKILNDGVDLVRSVCSNPRPTLHANQKCDDVIWQRVEKTRRV